MNEENRHIDYFELIPKYLSGNASDTEVELLEKWVLSAEKNKKQFNAFKKAWMLSGIAGNPHNIDVENEWQDTAKQLFVEYNVRTLPTKSKRRLGLYIRIAAAAIVLLASVWIFQSMNQDDFIEVITKNEIEDSQFPDGTEIALNRFSTIKYLPGKDQKTRNVELKGDAFFEVERDTARPFVITAQDVEIMVLGTAFYVDAREGISEVQVIVQEGSVSVSAGSEKVILAADEVGIYNKKTGSLTKSINKDVNYMAWKTGVLSFEGISLEQVVFDLNRKFHAKISIADEEIKSCPLNTTFDDKPLDAIVKIIEETFGIKAEINGESIVFSGKSCY